MIAACAATYTNPITAAATNTAMPPRAMPAHAAAVVLADTTAVTAVWTIAV